MWMGLLTTAGGTARVLGPIVFSKTYQDEGLFLTLGIIIGILSTALIINIVTYHRYKVIMDRWNDYYAEKEREKEAAAGRSINNMIRPIEQEDSKSVASSAGS